MRSIKAIAFVSFYFLFMHHAYAMQEDVHAQCAQHFALQKQFYEQNLQKLQEAHEQRQRDYHRTIAEQEFQISEFRSQFLLTQEALKKYRLEASLEIKKIQDEKESLTTRNNVLSQVVSELTEQNENLHKEIRDLHERICDEQEFCIIKIPSSEVKT